MEGVPSKEASNPPAKNNAGRQLAIGRLWPKPTDFVIGPAFEAFEERHDSATFSEREEKGCLKIWSKLARKGQACWTLPRQDMLAEEKNS